MRASTALSLALLVAGFAVARADTTEVSGSVSGRWSLSGSPYAVVGEVTVATGETLVIEPGVEVRFRGRYHFFVNGLLKAVGTESDSIIFTRDQPVEEHKWMGIRFDTCQYGCSLAWCRVEYVKNDGAYPRCAAARCTSKRGRRPSPTARSATTTPTTPTSTAPAAGCSSRTARRSSSTAASSTTRGLGRRHLHARIVVSVHPPLRGRGQHRALLGRRDVPGGAQCRLRLEQRHPAQPLPGRLGRRGITLWNWYAMNVTSKHVVNNLIYANVANADGGGIYTRYDLSFIYSNTIVGNSASRGGGIYVLNEGRYLPDVRNAIVWGNTAGSGASVFLDNANNSQINLAWSDVEGGWQGTGNFDSLPNFEDTVWFRLASPSRCIDAGTSRETPEFDFEGDARFDDPGSPNRGTGDTTYYDVGWDEFIGTGIEEIKSGELRIEKRGANLVRGVLLLPQDMTESSDGSNRVPRLALRDAAGRKVLALRPGPNDVSHLAPGVYFVRGPGPGAGEQGLAAVQKVIITR